MNCEHHYEKAGEDYHKANGETTTFGSNEYDQSVSYTMLYCTICGETKEIISKDQRQVVKKKT